MVTLRIATLQEGAGCCFSTNYYKVHLVLHVNGICTEVVVFQFAEGVVLDMDAMWEESTNRTPLICFLSMGSDPTENIERLAKQKSISKFPIEDNESSSITKGIA